MKLRATRIFVALVGFSVSSLVGCSFGKGSSNSGSTSTSSAVDLSGNWQFQVTSSGNTPFTGLSGYLNEEVGSAGNSSLTTASLQVQSTSCFSASKVLDFQGFTQDPYTQLTSFTTYSQNLALNVGTACTGGVSLCGGYQVTGGCSDGTSGQIVGVKYSQLKGIYSSSSSSSPSVRLTLSQAAFGSGQGGFEVSGSLAFAGSACLSAGTIDVTQSYVSGSQLHLVATTNATNSPLLTVSATINPAATSMTLDNISLAGNTCLSSLTGAGLTQGT